MTTSVRSGGGCSIGVVQQKRRICHLYMYWSLELRVVLGHCLIGALVLLFDAYVRVS